MSAKAGGWVTVPPARLRGVYLPNDGAHTPPRPSGCRDVARSNATLAVRRRALFWLGQSGDPRALALFESLLRR